MPSPDLSLAEAYADPAVQAFGKALRAAMTFEKDYGSLMDFENAETADAFNNAVKKFLRRNYASATRPTAGQLEHLMSLAKSDRQVRTLRAAIISYGLSRWDKREDK